MGLTVLNAFNFQVEKLMKALKDYYSGQRHGDTHDQKTDGSNTSQVYSLVKWNLGSNTTPLLSQDFFVCVCETISFA